MPVYLCRPGINKPDSWRHGMEVWLSPHGSHEDQEDDDNSMDARPVPNIAKGSVAGYIVRRIRHAEVVLADEVSEQYGRYWLRLRWPGPNGGFAGYVDAGPVVVSDQNNEAEFDRNDVYNSVEKNKELGASEKLTPLLCRATSKYYPSTDFFKLLGMYDDGLNLDDNNVENNGTGVDVAEETSTPGLLGAAEAENTDVEDEDGVVGGGEIKQALMPMTEPVFCRICREGLHDVEFDTLPDVGVPQATTDVKQASSEGSLYRKEGNPEKQAKTLIKKFQSHPLSENPLMSPCECSGSMAFVHRLCVEEWRCRSRHPAARNGLNCETCGGDYALPPPPIRPQDEVGADGAGGGGAFAEDDWVDAMPAHVLAALRRPHPWWRFCATVVRRKWLRPLAPIICSPIVATYCRCRRMLKKRGVSRRRWACSLCRRRARWKCVRCLRSYYCSRQCQNVSWHIMHKHMCYKPSRVWWSSVVYGVLIVTLFPGIWQNPFVYWTVLINMMTGFLLSSNLAGSIATIMKKVFRVDLRGRCLEFSVVLTTLGIGFNNWGVIWGFFGHPERCIGAFGAPFKEDLVFPPVVHLYSKTILVQIASLLKGFDRLATSIVAEPKVCNQPLFKESGGTMCFVTPNDANPFFLTEAGGETCVSDIHVSVCLYVLTAIFIFIAYVLKKTDRRARVAVGRRPHLD